MEMQMEMQMQMERAEGIQILGTFGSAIRCAFTRKDVIGTGSSGKVYKARVFSGLYPNEEAGVAAVKQAIFNGREAEDHSNVQSVTHWAVLPSLKHDNVVSYQKICIGKWTRAKSLIVEFTMEYFEGTNLATILSDFSEREGKLNLRTALDFSKQLATGLAYLHKSRIVHGALTPSAVLVGKPVGNCNHVKITGYDRVTALDNSQTGSKTDVWSLGCIILQLANFSFKVDQKALEKPILLAEGYTPRVSESIPRDFANILHGCLRASNDEKFTAEQLANKLVEIEEHTYGSISKYYNSASDLLFDDTCPDEDFHRQMNETLGCSCRYDYKFPHDYIGQGGFGTVYKATINEFGDYTGSCVVAVKEVVLDALKVRRLRNKELWEAGKKRWRSLLKLKHPNLVAYFQITIRKLLKGVGVDFMMEYCAGGDLNAFLERHTASVRMSTETAVDYAMQITNGLIGIHQNGFVHGDLKPNNVFIKTKGDSRFTLLIGDLDGIVIVQENSAALEERRGLAGTVPYMSPEMVSMTFQEEDAEKAIGFHVDVWSLGCVILDLFDCCFGVEERWFCQQTMDDSNKMSVDKIQRKEFSADAFLFKLKDGYRPFIDPLIPNDMTDIITSCLEYSCSKRSTAEEVFQHLCDLK